MIEKRLLNIKEASEYLGIAVGTLYNLASQKRIQVVKLGNKCIRIDKFYLDKLIKEKTVDIYSNNKNN